MTKNVKGIGLLSGGLDSTLAVKVLQEQGIEVTGITFVTPFFGPGPGIEAGVKAGIEVLPVDISEKHLDMLKSPVYGYGSQMNPCIDCHGLMLKEAGRIMEQRGADFLFTGEVVGQRPMSQRRDSLRSVEKLSGYQGRVLRPLSAKLLPPTTVELEGLVDRERLLDISGRSRKRQTELAERYGIGDYPQPGGGCMLTKEGFANRLKELFRAYPNADVRCVELLKWGRIFRLPQGSILIAGRHKSDNSRLDALAKEMDVQLKTVDRPGPTGLIPATDNPLQDLEAAALIVASYADVQRAETTRVYWRHGRHGGIIESVCVNKESLKEMLI